MKLRYLSLILLPLLTACNMTLAADITPPPGYVAPTPLPTLALYPSQPPSVENGKIIYAEKCAACHGETGLGDGEQGIQLGVTVRAFGLAEIARPASPAQYYTMVTRGNIERFMPPFNSLNDQERWDVVAYVMTLHTTAEEIERGRQLFESNCNGCSLELFQDQLKMSSFTEVELARLASQGGDGVPAFGANLSEDELWAVAVYLRTLSFDTSLPATPLPVAVASATAAPVGTPADVSQITPAVEPQAGFGNVVGTIENKTGEDLPSDLVVTLTGFDHDANDPNAGPVEVFTAEGSINADRTYRFENIEMPANRIFLAELTYEGVEFQSEFAIAEDGAQLVNIPPLTLYSVSEDFSALVMEDVQAIFDYGTDTVSVYTLYSFRNPTDAMIVVAQDEAGQIPFIKVPQGSLGFGFEPTQDSAAYLPTADGFAIPPSENSYGLVSFSTLPLTDEVGFSLPFALPVNSINVFTPVGVEVQSSQMTDLGVQTIQNFTYQIYQSNAINEGGSLDFTLTGAPSDTPASAAGGNTSLLIGAGILGAALLAAGLWMYRREARTDPTGDETDDEFDSAEEVMDAIIALDDLHGKKKIVGKAYQKRREELKEILKGMI